MKETNKKEERFELRMSKEMLAEGQTKAKELDISFAWVIRRLIKLWLEGKINLE